MIRPVLLFGAFLILTSCGNKELTLCDCYGLKNKYDSIDKAKEDLGEDVINHCNGLMKEAKEDDIKKCEE